MRLDVIELACRRHAGERIDPADERRQMRIVSYTLEVTFEVRVVDEIEPDERREERNVRLGDHVAAEEGCPAQRRLTAFERGEELGAGLGVRGLAGREAGPVHAVVDGLVVLGDRSVDRRDELGGCQRGDGGRFAPFVERVPEHPHELA